MEGKTDNEVYNEIKKKLEAQTTKLQRLTASGSKATVVEVQEALAVFKADLESSFANVDMKKGMFQRLKPGFDAYVPSTQKWCDDKVAQEAFEVVKRELNEACNKVLDAEKRKDYPEMSRCFEEYKLVRDKLFPPGGAWTKIGYQQRWYDSQKYKVWDQQIASRIKSGAEQLEKEKKRGEEDAVKKQAADITRDMSKKKDAIAAMKPYESRLNAEKKAAIITALNELEKHVLSNKAILSTLDHDNFVNWIKYQREVLEKPASPPPGRKTSSWPDCNGMAGTAGVFVICSQNSLYSVDENGRYGLLGEYNGFPQVHRGSLAFGEKNGKLYVVSSDTLYAVDTHSGKCEQVGKYRGFSNSLGVAAANDNVFVVSERSIYRVRYDGSYETFSEYGGWGGTTALAASGKFVFALCDQRIYRIEEDGTHTYFDSTWTNVAAMCAFKNFLYVVSDSRLYKVEMHNGEYEKLKGNWPDVTGLCATNTKLFCVSQNALYSADPETGDYEQL